MVRSNVRQSKRKEDELMLAIEDVKRRYDEFDPKEAKTFADFPLSQKTLNGLKKGGFVEPTDIQRESIVVALRCCDVLGAAMTGSGKTLAFLIPILEILWRERWSPYDGVGALIISPTRELAMQIYDVLRIIGAEHDFSAALVVGGTNVNYESKRLAGKNIVVGTPGRLLQHMDENPDFTCDSMKALVIDEADRLLDMGFEGQLNAIISNLPEQRQTLLFSATQTKSVKDLARLSLKDPVYVSVHEHAKYSTPEQLKQSYVICEDHEKIDMLWSFVKNHQQVKVLVFMANCKQVRFAYDAFRRFRPRTTILCLHGSMVQMKRVNVYQQFCNKNHVVLLATDIAARGLDFPSVDWVVQIDCPPDANEYIHRCGRTARYHRDGKSLLVLTPSQETAMIEELRSKKIPISKITMNPTMLANVQKKLMTFCTQDAKFKTLAQQAFVAYVRSVFLMSNKRIFDVKQINYEAMARSYGLAMTPRIRFLRKQASNGSASTVYSKPPNPVNEPTASTEDTKADAALLEIAPKEIAQEFSGWADNETEADEGLLIVKKKDVFNVAEQSNNPEATTNDELAVADTAAPTSSRKKQPLTRELVAKKILKKKIVPNKKLTFDDEGNLNIGLNTRHAEQASGNDDSSYQIEEAKRTMELEDKLDRQLHRKRIKEKHKEEKRKKKLVEMEKRQKNRKTEAGPQVTLGVPAEEVEVEGFHSSAGSGDEGSEGESSGAQSSEGEDEHEDIGPQPTRKKRRLVSDHDIQMQDIDHPRHQHHSGSLTLQDAEKLALQLIDA